MKTNQLSATEVKTRKKPGYYCDGGGLYLRVTEHKDVVSRSWIFRFSSPVMRNDAGKSKIRDMGLGPYPTLSLAEARAKAKDHRQEVLAGDDPIQARIDQRTEARKLSADTMLFRDAVRRFLDAYLPTLSNAKSRQQWENTLATYVVPKLGNHTVASIDPALLNEP